MPARLRKRRNSLPQCEILPDALKAVTSAQPTPVVSTPDVKELSYATFAKKYSAQTLLAKGDWVNPVQHSHTEAHAAELMANLRLDLAQEDLLTHQLSMLKRGSQQSIRSHAIQHSTRYPPEEPCTEAEQEEVLEQVRHNTACTHDALIHLEPKGSNSAQASDWKDTTGVDAFLELVASNNIFEVRSALENGMDPNATDARGWTALHQACYMGDTHMRISDLLLKRGAEPYRCTYTGQVALDFAERYIHSNTIQLLKNWRTGRALLKFSRPTFVVATV